METNTDTAAIYKEGDIEATSARSVIPVVDITLGLLRVVAGLMLMQHGVQKHFGLLLGPGMPPFQAPDPLSQMWIAGTLEIAGGFLLALGLFTRWVGFILSGFMASAYFLVHAKRGFFPVLNQGELAALYCFVFLMFAGVGGGRFSLDALIARRHARGPFAKAGETLEPRKRRSRWRRRRLPETRTH